MLAKDGHYGRRTFDGSGAMLSNATRGEISKYLTIVDIGTEVEGRSAAFEKARKSNKTYVVEPTILHWEDRATEWSGRPDRITIKLVVWDPKTERVLTSSVERASSKWGTLGGDHPQDLLARMLRTSIGRLFR